ncbi:MAG: hypothetical protein Q4D26_09285 [Clostridia bacterium]|nr:hypothetical protein [Clostridia bacterium]
MLDTIAGVLACYEDLAEQGKLLKLPCKVGDTVYLINPLYKNKETGLLKYNIIDGKIYAIHIGVDRFNNPVEYFHTRGTFCLRYSFRAKISDIGKTVFLTKEAAEAALRKMEGKNETVI